ncbi:MAG: selenocysteine-specific translation elongation factor [Dehalococcoidia bacterium]|nr:selenocysteine-specific translation elongation factor [Dehalococcoidia bacterium]
MFVIGTAGHVDHGKSALIEAITGIHPDRLIEEQTRGLTIELGFGWTNLPSGIEVSLIDVPGHVRFVRHMLSGVGGIDAALLVVAADEGIMPQTTEHMNILNLLGITKGIVVFTKCDLVDEDWLNLLKEDFEDTVMGTPLQNAPIVFTSTITGSGISELITELDELVSELDVPRNINKSRLPIDRVFTMIGFGTVVTGTLLDGHLEIGDLVEISPTGKTARIRGLQAHGKEIEIANPGSRVAVNLSGLQIDEISRGHVLGLQGSLTSARSFDASINLINDEVIKHNLKVHVHVGSAEIQGRIRLLEPNSMQPRDQTFVQILLSEPISISEGDLYVVRISDRTLGGGKVLSINPPRHKRSDTAVLDLLSQQLTGTVETRILGVLEQIQPATQSQITSALTESIESIDDGVEKLISGEQIVRLQTSEQTSLLITNILITRIRTQAKQIIDAYNQQWHLRFGIPKEELRATLKLDSRLFSALLDTFQTDLVDVNEDIVALKNWTPQLNQNNQAEAKEIIDSLHQGKFFPPRLDSNTELFGYLERMAEIKDLGDGVAFTQAHYLAAARLTLEQLNIEQNLSLGEIRDLINTNRRIAQALGETMDKEGLTQRVGDERRITEAGKLFLKNG